MSLNRKYMRVTSMADGHRPLSQVLHQAIATGDLDTVQALLQKGVNANSTLIARCPIDRHSLSIDVKRSSNVDTRSVSSDRYSLGMDRYSLNNNNNNKVYMKDGKTENNNFIDYDCRNSLRETPIIESDYEQDEDDDLIKKCVDEDVAANDLISKCSDKNDSVKKAGKCIDRTDVVNYKAVDKADTANCKVEKCIDNDNAVKYKAEKCVDEDEALRELLEKCSEDDIAVNELIGKCVDKGNLPSDNIKEPSVYCEDVERPISLLIPLNPCTLDRTTTGEMTTSTIGDKLNDDNKVLIERSPSLIVEPRPQSEELLIEEKPLKLVPRLKKKLSNRWRSKDAAIKGNKPDEKCVVNRRRKSRNVDNEQLNENYEGLAFFEAVREGMDMTVQTLLETSNNNQLNMPDENGFSPLMQAAWHGQQECLKVLLDHGANVSLRNNTGCTATHFAAAQGNLNCLDVLINYGHVNVNSQTKFSATPLILAAKGGHSDCVTLLLESGADVNMQYRGNQNALLFAAGNGHFECMEILIANGVQLDQANSQGVTPLMRAIQQGHNECARLLIGKHVDINIQDVIGRTPIHFAIEHDNPEGLKLLIESGANADVRTRGDSTPLDYLERFPSARCEEILNAHLNASEESETFEKELEKQKTKTSRTHTSCISCIKFHRRHKTRNKNDA